MTPSYTGKIKDTSADGVATDPGMAVKMQAPAFAGLAELAAGRPCDEAELIELCDFADARLDCCDFRLVTILTVLSRWSELLTPATRERCEQTVLGFKYWMDEPGDDGICFWSENHQALFAACEFVAGGLYADRTFTSGGFTGEQRRTRGRERLMRWLADRRRYGFTEWLSATYYEEDVAALVLAIDHGGDAEVAQAAREVFDLLALDLALHRFDGQFIASAGRAYEAQKKDPAAAEVAQVVRRMFDRTARRPEDFDLTRLSAAYVLSDLEVPEAIAAIAADPRSTTVRVSHGLDCEEVVGRVGPEGEVETTGAFFWLMEAFVNPPAVRTSMAALTTWQMQRNTFLKPMAPFAHVPKLLLPRLVQALNPAVLGCAIERANVVTTRTPYWLMSAAQRYRPRGFGDQQSLWIAALPGPVTVFATHPGAPMFDETARGFSPSAWVGNGVNPDVFCDQNLLVAVHDLRGVRRGYLERKRIAGSHLWFPAERFDEVVRAGRVIVGRIGESLIGVIGLGELRDGEPGEIVQDGELTAWAVACSDVGVSGSAEHFAAGLAATRLVVSSGVTTWHVAGLPAGAGRRVITVHRDGPALVDGVEISTDHPRLNSVWGHAERFSEDLRVECEGKSWQLG